MEPDTLQKQADHCNDRRMASKRVQELSISLFFAVLVKVRVHPGPSSPFPSLLCMEHQCRPSPEDAMMHFSYRRVAPWSPKPW